jgi:hypothetical protein
VVLVINLNGGAPWVIEIVRRIRRTKITSCKSRLTCWNLDSCSFGLEVEKAEVAVLYCGRPLVPPQQIVEEGVAVLQWARNAKYRWAGRRSPDPVVVPVAAAVYGAALYAEAAVVGSAVLGHGGRFVVRSRKAAPVVYSGPAPAAERHGQI